MNEHRYILEPYKGMNTLYICPSCKQGKKFKLYIDTETGEHISPTVGRCNRESNCGYHYKPKQYFIDNNFSFDVTTVKRIATPLATNKNNSFIPVEVFKLSLKSHDQNNFVKFLIQLFGTEITGELISKYFIATSKHWSGANVFWQIDANGKIRTGKIMLYNAITGKRIKEPYNHIDWVHSVLKLSEYNLQQCLFGEHLLQDKTKPVAIVESEKTAVIASTYLPQFIWCAAGSLTNLNAEKCKVLTGRNVILFPDLNGFEKWKAKADELSHITKFNVSDLLERKATEAERKQGLDIADYLIKLNYKDFISSDPTPTEKIKIKQPESWVHDLNELKKYFESITLPTEAVMLNQCTKIKNVAFLIQSHFAIIETAGGKEFSLPYLNRLKELKQCLI